MAKELLPTTGLPASLTESINMGKVFFESGLFTDLKSAAQAVVKIQAGAEMGIPAFASLSGIHIIQGKPTIGAGLIASRVKGSGKYDYDVKEHSEKVCSIDFYQGKKMLGNSTFTIADAQKAGTKNLDKFPKNMLFARAISNGVKWFAPDVFNGPVYTFEEMGETQTTEDVKHEEVKSLPMQEPAPINKVTITEAGFNKLLQKLNAPNADIDAIVKDTMDKLDLTDAQAQSFAEMVASLQTVA